jgi:hypothetical protein
MQVFRDQHMLISLGMCPQVEKTATNKILDFDSSLAQLFNEKLIFDRLQHRNDLF